MKPVLVDTCVLSYLINRHTLAEAYARVLVETEPLISFVTLGEIYGGALRNNWGETRWARLEQFLSMFPVVAYDRQVSRKDAEVIVSLDLAGRPVGANDCWIAECALAAGIPLVTHNRKHFDWVPGLSVIAASV